MEQAHVENLKPGDHIVFTKPPKIFVKAYNQFTNQIDMLETVDGSIVGNIFEIIFVEIPFIILSNTINLNSFTFDIRNGGRICVPSKEYVNAFKEQFAQNLNPCIMTVNNFGSGLPPQQPPPPPPQPPFSNSPL